MKNYFYLLATICCIAACNLPNNDKSQSVDEAIKNGLPSLKGEWVAEDLKKYNAYLGICSKEAYPKLNSKKSNPIFKKLISAAKQPRINDKSLPLQQRMPYAINIQAEMSSTLSLYANARSIEEDYALELCYLQGMNLEASAQIIQVIQEFQQTLDPNSHDYSIRMEGLQQMRGGSNEQLEGTLISLQETHNYTDKERKILVTYFIENSPTLLNFIESEAKEAFQQKLEQHLVTEANTEIKQLLTDFSSSL